MSYISWIDMKKITILTSCSYKPDIIEGNLGLFLDSASDSDLSKYYRKAILLNQLFPETEKQRRLASHTANIILANEPRIRNIPQLTILHEAVANELLKNFRIMQLHQILIDEGYKICEFISPSWLGNGLSELVKLIASPLVVKIPCSQKLGRIRRIYTRILANNFSLSTLYDEFHNILNQVDRFHYRDLLFNNFKKTKIEKKQIWAYTTAVNYTNICLMYEPFLPQPCQFLVENNRTGGKPLFELNRQFYSLYSFILPQFIPQNDEIKYAVHTIHQHIQNAFLDGKAVIAKNLFLQSKWLKTFYTRLLPNGLMMSSICENWLQMTQPSMIIIGNPGYESHVTYQARERNISTLVLQHGLMGGYYPYYDHLVDYYLVRGKFWQDLLSPPSKQRSFILNFPLQPEKFISPIKEKKYIVFVTTPDRNSEDLYIDTDRESILQTVFKAMDNSSMRLVIRVHPREKIASYKKMINKLQKNMPSKVLVTYSQGGCISELISHAITVIMYCSTVFLDCIRYDIPIISFNWIHFGFMERLKEYKIFYFANNLSDLKRLIMRAMLGELPVKLKTADFFLAKTSSLELQNNLTKIHRYSISNSQ